MLDKPPSSLPGPTWPFLYLPRVPVPAVSLVLARMAKAIQLCLQTTQMVLGWLVLIILVVFCFGALPVLCLALFWL